MISVSTFLYLLSGASVLSYIAIPILLVLVYLQQKKLKGCRVRANYVIGKIAETQSILNALVDFQGLEVKQGPTVDFKEKV